MGFVSVSEVRDERGNLVGLVENRHLPSPFAWPILCIPVRPPQTPGIMDYFAKGPIESTFLTYHEIRLEWRAFASGTCVYPSLQVRDSDIPHLGFWPLFRFTEIAGNPFVQSPKWAVFAMMDKGWQFTLARRAA